MGIDNKYGRITTEHGDIADDEPVFLFRAKDALLPQLLLAYYDLCDAEGSPQHHLDGIRTARANVRAWQANHFIQVPNSNSMLPR